jgi:hypothetical protein
LKERLSIDKIDVNIEKINPLKKEFAYLNIFEFRDFCFNKIMKPVNNKSECKK